MLRTEDWIEEKLQCNLMVSLARLLFSLKKIKIKIGFVWMNWTNLEFNEFDLIGLRMYYNKLDSNWLELDCVFEVP